MSWDGRKRITSVAYRSDGLCNVKRAAHSMVGSAYVRRVHVPWPLTLDQKLEDINQGKPGAVVRQRSDIRAVEMQ